MEFETEYENKDEVFEFKIENMEGSDHSMVDYIKILNKYELAFKGKDIYGTGKIPLYSDVEYYITITSLKDLMNLKKELNVPLIIEESRIIIFDGNL